MPRACGDIPFWLGKGWCALFQHYVQGTLESEEELGSCLWTVCHSYTQPSWDCLPECREKAEWEVNDQTTRRRRMGSKQQDEDMKRECRVTFTNVHRSGSSSVKIDPFEELWMETVQTTGDPCSNPASARQYHLHYISPPLGVLWSSIIREAVGAKTSKRCLQGAGK
eukprot:Gb_15210 [translate_table: standard]